MNGMPIWFGAEGRPLFGWFHCPADAKARAGVVICAPIGRDYLRSHYAMRLLAERLSDRELAVLRFDYDGTGDSAGSDWDADRVPSWLGSIRAAVEVMRSSGVGHVTLVGMRLGALLAALVAEQDPFDGLVLWDPVVSGRRYLAEQKTLSAFIAPASESPSTEWVEAPGMIFTPTTAATLRGLDLTKLAGPLAPRSLILLRPDRPAGPLTETLDGPGTDWAQAAGQAEMMDFDAELRTLPVATIDSVVEWISAVAPAQLAALEVPASALPATVGVSSAGSAVVEIPVEIGPSGLFGILCEPESGACGPAVVMLNPANEHRVGPARMWVELSRRWAAAGIRCLRMDLSGLGDSPVRHAGQKPFSVYRPEAFDDVSDAARFVSPDHPSDIVLVGLCSSAYQALDSAFGLTPRSVIAIQPGLSFCPPEVLAGGPVDPRRRTVQIVTPAVAAFLDGGPLAALRRRLPNIGWRVRLWAHPRRRPGAWLRELERSGVDLMLVCSDREERPLRLGTSARQMERLRGSGRLHLHCQADLVHGLLVAEQRHAVADVMTDYLVGRFVSSGAPDPQAVIAAPEVTGSRQLVNHHRSRVTEVL